MAAPGEEEYGNHAHPNRECGDDRLPPDTGTSTDPDYEFSVRFSVTVASDRHHNREMQKPHGTDQTEYVLGTHDEELRRLGVQHEVWVDQARAVWARAGIRPGHTVLDLGSGPGFTTFALAEVVGPTGHVIASDRSPRFIDYVRTIAALEEANHVAAILGDVEQIELQPDSLDAAYARWLLCWVPDPGAILRRMATLLKPGGAFVIQDYLDWGAMKLLPRDATFDRAVDACMAAWHAGDGMIDIAEEIPSLAREAGFVVESFEPISRVGKTSSPEWTWIGGFLSTFLPRLAAQSDLISDAEVQSFLETWKSLTDAGESLCYAPTVADIVLRRM